MIVVDTETSGVNPKNHSIVSIGAVDFANTQNQFYGECKVWDGADIMEESLEVNGFSKKDITDPTKQSLEILLRGFFDWVGEIEDKTVAGTHVGYFDLKFLEDSADRVNLNFPLSRGTIDLHTLTYMHMVQRGEELPMRNGHSDINSKFMYKYVGLTGIDVPHHALEDARLEAEAISRLLHRKNLFDEFKKYSIPW